MPHKYAKLPGQQLTCTVPVTSIDDGKFAIVDMQAHIGQSSHTKKYRTCPITSPLQAFIFAIHQKTFDILIFIFPVNVYSIFAC